MSTNLGYRERKRQRKRESRRQASEAQRERATKSWSERQNKIKVCSGGEKMRNASGHQGENEWQ